MFGSGYWAKIFQIAGRNEVCANCNAYGDTKAGTFKLSDAQINRHAKASGGYSHVYMMTSPDNSKKSICTN
jgi:hypothetical protein